MHGVLAAHHLDWVDSFVLLQSHILPLTDGLRVLIVFIAHFDSPHMATDVELLA